MVSTVMLPCGFGEKPALFETNGQKPTPPLAWSMSTESRPPRCCGEVRLTDGKELYSHRPDLWEKPFWFCEGCKGYVGCHAGTTHPLGTPATAELRRARAIAHRWFDSLWKEGHVQRKDAYKMLAEYLGIERKQCHIGQFDYDTCHRVLSFVTYYRSRLSPC